MKPKIFKRSLQRFKLSWNNEGKTEKVSRCTKLTKSINWSRRERTWIEQIYLPYLFKLQGWKKIYLLNQIWEENLTDYRWMCNFIIHTIDQLMSIIEISTPHFLVSKSKPDQLVASQNTFSSSLLCRSTVLQQSKIQLLLNLGIRMATVTRQICSQKQGPYLWIT